MTDYNPTQPTSEIVTTATHGELVLSNQRELDQNPALVYLGSLNSLRSQRTQKNSLEVIAEMLTGSKDILALDWGALRYQHCALIRAELSRRYAKDFANLVLCALRRTLKEAWRLGQMSADEYQKAADLEGIKGETLPAGRALSSGELAALMAACENDITPAGARDAAMICCMYPAGLRRSEVVMLDLGDYDPENGGLTVRHGKGNKARISYLTNGARRAMADWLSMRGSEPGALFWAINKGGKMTPRRINNQAIYNLCVKRGNQAGVSEFSPHDLRRSFVSDLLDAGADIVTVAKLAGHASVSTTQRYDRRPEAAKQKAAELLHMPYRGRLVK